MHRRDFLKSATLASTATLAAPLLSRAVDPATQPSVITPKSSPVPVIRSGPYLQCPTEKTITIRWITTVPAYSWVEYGPTPSLGMRVDSTIDGLKQANNTLHAVTLTSLEWGETYYYRVCSQPITTFEPYKIAYSPTLMSDIIRFNAQTRWSDEVNFVMFNDLHDNLAQWRKLHAQVAGQKFDFAFLNGDVTDFLTDEKQMVEHFLDPATELFAKDTPFWYARGNHETRGAFARQMKDYLSLPNNQYFYAFSHGPARFVVLDTGEDKADNTPVYAGLCDFDAYRTAQQAFLEKELASDDWKDAWWRIAIWHIPGYYSDNQHTTLDSRKKFHEQLNDAKCNLYLGGHTHKYIVAKPDLSIGHNYPIAIGGGPKMGLGTITTVHIDQQHLKLKMIRDDGQTVGKLML